MALPIFLRPLLLISYYYRVLTQTFARWLERSNEQLFGPLEQMIVAVVITGLAMNPGLLPQLYPQVPIPPTVPFPIRNPSRGAPVDNEDTQAPTRPSPALPTYQPSPQPDMRPQAGGITSTGHAWLDCLLEFLPAQWRPNTLTLSLLILLISVLIHIAPRDLLRRLKRSWDLFWPPWQDRRYSSRMRSNSGRAELVQARGGEPGDGKPSGRTEFDKTSKLPENDRSAPTGRAISEGEKQWDSMTEEQQKRYLVERQRRKQAGESDGKGKARAEDDKVEISILERKRELDNHKEKEKAREAELRREKWEKLTDEEKAQYLRERMKRDKAAQATKAQQNKAGEGSGLSAEDKEKL